MQYEWDEAKRRSNIGKHALDFADAAEVLAGLVVDVPDTREYGEDRWLAIGALGSRVVVVVYVGSDEGMTRIISMRKAVPHERDTYQQAVRDRLGPA